jgi:hypothetical protein
MKQIAAADIIQKGAHQLFAMRFDCEGGRSQHLRPVSITRYQYKMLHAVAIGIVAAAIAAAVA